MELHASAKIAWERGRLHAEEGALWDAFVQYQRAVAFDPGNSTYWNGLGVLLVRLDRWDEALRAYARAVELNPNFAFAWKCMGECLEHLDRFEEALDAYRVATHIDPYYSIAWKDRIALLRKLGRAMDALQISQAWADVLLAL